MDYPILSEIKSPAELKKLNIGEINELCREIRCLIIDTVSKNGGHLASNLGVVELTVALHRAFESPNDAIIFDVGHQCYTHKLLTGRFKEFSTIRQQDGISGFLKPKESEHDQFITGHSSNSVSAAYGIYKAKKLKGEEGTAIAVIGDGALTGGMAYEALNNIGNTKGNFIVVLNDNKMSISDNVGSLSRILTKLRNRTHYHRFKFVVNKLFLKIPFIGIHLNSFLFKVKEAFKNAVYSNNIFSSLGFNYLCPVDGHNVEKLESLFQIAKSYSRPSLVHVITTKGKGYSFAEEEPKYYHGVSSFDVDKGADNNFKTNFSSVAGDTLCNIAKENNKVCAVTAAMTEGTGIYGFSIKYPDRFFDDGIAEQHAITFCAGLAKKGLIPYFAVYSSFLQRGYDQIIHDCAIGNFPVKILVDRAGFVGEDGETHQGLFDVSFITSIPNTEIYSPSTYKELEYIIKKVADNKKISAIRYPRGKECDCLPFDCTKDYCHIKADGNIAIITYGRLFAEASKLDNVNIFKLNKIYPLSDSFIKEVSSFGVLHFYEESVKSGGIAEHLSAELLKIGYKGKYYIHSVENEFVPAMSVDNAIQKYGLDFNSMKKDLTEKK